ncbi:MAG: SdpI family protein [Clostridium sp.]|nr:SdpI family protein [Clostridium sp.]
MAVNIWLLICTLIVPITLLIVGSCFVKHIPKNINGIVGYRTSRSMKNKDTWKFAHEYCGKLWVKFGNRRG